MQGPNKIYKVGLTNFPFIITNDFEDLDWESRSRIWIHGPEIEGKNTFL
jgi:hypothetical protein